MAAYFLRLGRLGSFKGLQVNSWVTPKKGPALWFCTQTDEPKRPVKKTKAVGKTEAPHDRAALLAHRTAVSFPSRLSEPGGLPLGGTEDSAPQVVEPLAEVECGSLAPGDELGSAGAAENGTIASSEPQDTAAESSSSSSSSSDSDSDLDSDFEDNKLDGEGKIRKVSPEWADAIPGETRGTNEAAGGVEQPGRGPRGRSEESETLSPETGSGTPADVIENAAASLITEAHNKTPSLQVVQAEAPVEVSAEPAEVSREPQRVAAPRTVTSKSVPPEAEALSTAEDLKDPALVSEEGPEEDLSLETAAEVSKEPQRVAAPRTVTSKSVPPEAEALSTAEDLKDPALVSAEGPEEDLSLETAAEQLEEPTAAAVEPTEPEEPFDNSTYKNCQHHSYTPYTFVDLDVDMAKYRLPQPSSGRPSPLH